MKLLTVFISISICLFLGCKQKSPTPYSTNSVFYFNDNTPNKIDTLKKYVIGNWQLQAWLYTENGKDFYCNPEVYDSVKVLSSIFNVSIDTSIFENISHYLDTVKWTIDSVFIRQLQEKMKNPNENLFSNSTKREIRFYETGEQMVLKQTKNDLTLLFGSLGKYKFSCNGDIYEQIIQRNGSPDSLDITNTKVEMFGRNCFLVSTPFDSVALKDYTISSQHFIRFYKRKL